MLAETHSRVGRYSALKNYVSERKILVLLILVVALIWPWASEYFWKTIMVSAVEKFEPGYGWRDLRVACRLGSLALWFVPILFVTEGVLKQRMNGAVLPLIIYMFVWMEVAIVAAYLLIWFFFWLGR